ncbi:hypothetical protein VHEMI07053 [[Torrubiella] hemipterigena]|uniref:Uncharacterized protein n=1 Tax=[Torrubiella] hemipterigena TaxID=1531966 RepID=A0A0A1T973_9HYPO|nr:hypothetical protein VHEMI07053 [[Torrubiella] hemipterigena]
MSLPTDLLLVTFTATLSLCLYLLLQRYRWSLRRTPSHIVKAISANRDAAASSSLSEADAQSSKLKQDDKYQQLYFKLHNIEAHPEVLTEGRDVLLSLLSEAITVAQPERRQDIFAIEHFTREQLFSHTNKSHEIIGDKYERYVEGRVAGNGRLMATDRQQAAKILTALAPLKLVDGAWLGHIHQILTPFALRPITKQAWQVLSEELGDGNLELNHVHLFNRLLQDVGVHLPAPYERDFIDPRHGMDSELVWRAAVTQLLVSLYPQEFLPEILGYSLHFEGLSMETMVLSRELQELKLDAQYFLLHVSIDNAHSGHAMMTAHTVAEYMAHITQTETPAVASTTWRRIQAGYALSAYQGDSIQKHLISNKDAMSGPTPGLYDSDIVRMLVAKAAVGQKMHSACHARIKGKPLAQWLDPEVLQSDERVVQELGNAYPWIIKGRPQHSRLIREIRRGGKMFGAFTVTETKLLNDWILSLGSNLPEADAYWQFTNRPLENQQDTPALYLANPYKCDQSLQPVCHPLYSYINMCDRVLDLDLSQADWTRIAGLWFAQLSLLEGCVAIPSRAATPIGAAIIRILRAQYSLSCEEDGVSGMDEIHRSSPPDLVAIGLEISSRKGLVPLPSSLSETLARWPCPSAEHLVKMSRHPVQNCEILLGMTGAFVHLQRAVLHAPRYLSEQSRAALEEIIDREVQGLRAACELIEDDGMEQRALSRGYQLAEEMIQEAVATPL